MEELSSYFLRHINNGLIARPLIPSHIYKKEVDYLWHLYTLTCKTYTEEDSINQLKN